MRLKRNRWGGLEFLSTYSYFNLLDPRSPLATKKEIFCQDLFEPDWN